MIVRDIAEKLSRENLEIANGVYFHQDYWRIKTGPGEHVSFTFNDILDSKNENISAFPDLKEMVKILTYYSFPDSAISNVRSWASTKAHSILLRGFAREFMFEQSLVEKSIIQNIDGEQIRDFLDHCARASNYSKTFADLTIRLPVVLETWIHASETEAMPAWGRANFTLSDVMSKEYERTRKELYERADSNTWKPLNAQQVKLCYDAAKDYIYELSDAIIKASSLIKGRPQMAGGRLALVRSDGRTKKLFRELESFIAPCFPGTDKKIFEFKSKTKKVRSDGYKSGYQDRTTIDINVVRPEVINLKRACIFIIGLLTGMRRAEIAHLKVGALFLRDGYDYLKITRFKVSSDPKRGTADEIPVPPLVAEAVRILERLFESQRNELSSDYLLVSDIVTKKMYPKIKIETISRDVSSFVEDFSGQTGHSHQLRKTLAWLLISKGEENVDLIRELFGHKSYGMTLRYILRNELLSGSVMELLEENYTQDLHEALNKITSGEAVGDLADSLRQRSVQHYPGQVLAADVESFVHSALETGVPLFISKTPIGAFCLSSSDVYRKKPPCIADTEDHKPNPEFCDYLSCPRVLHTSESIENVKLQISFYEKKLKFLPEYGDDRVEQYYTSKIEENRDLLDRLITRSKGNVIARSSEVQYG